MKRTLITFLVSPMALAAVVLWATAGAAVEICHIPPGNPDNRRVIDVNQRSVDKHILKHGDVFFEPVEVCDGLDNDCNIVVDDVPGVGGGCVVQIQPSDECTFEGVLECVQGSPSPQCVADILTEPEDCADGLDNDCDGLLDVDDPDCTTGVCVDLEAIALENPIQAGEEPVFEFVVENCGDVGLTCQPIQSEPTPGPLFSTTTFEFEVSCEDPSGNAVSDHETLTIVVTE